MDRRDAVKLLAASALTMVAGRAGADDQALMRIVVPYAAGGLTDSIARLLAASMQTTLARNVIVENRPGAAALIGTKYVQMAPPDGNTVLFHNTGLVSLPLLQKSANYDGLKDFTAVAQIGESANYLMVNDRVPAKNMTEFLAYARSTSDRIECANSGINSGGHISARLLEKLANIKLVHVPFKGSAETTLALISGEVKMQVTTTTDALNPYIKEGKIKILGIASKERSALTPDVPPIADTVPGYDYGGWFGIVAPANTPLAVRNTVSAAIKKALDEPILKERLIALFMEVKYQTPTEFEKTMAESLEVQKTVMASLGIVPQ